MVLVALSMTATMAACTKKNQTAEPGASASGGGGGTVKVAFVPKLQGIPYFEAMNAGGKEAARDGVEGQKSTCCATAWS